MLGSLFLAPVEATVPNPWQKWVNSLMKENKKTDCKVLRASLAYISGEVAAATKDFYLNEKEIKVRII